MAESSIFFSWGIPVPGRESKGLEVFQEALAFWGTQKAAGGIEDYKVGIAAQGSYAIFSGYLIVEGSRKNIAAALDSKEVHSLLDRAAHIVQNLTVVRCDTGSAIPQRIEQIVFARNQLGITT